MTAWNKKTDAQFRQELYNKFGNAYVPLDAYVDSHTKIRVKHTTCGYIWSARPCSLLHGTLCPRCAGNRKLTTADFKALVQQLTGNDYEVLGEYRNNHTPILMKHLICGRTFYKTPVSFRRGHYCPYCSRERKNAQRTQTLQQFITELHDLTGDEYTVVGHYVNRSTPVTIRHNKCGHVWAVRPTDFVSHHRRCPYCYGKLKTTQEFKREVCQQTHDSYRVLGNYVNAHTPILMEHKTCGYTWKAMPYAFVNLGERCPHCAQSHGEMLVENYLVQHNITYTTQRRFADLRDKHKLSYDFCINSKVLIEYQGIQHYQALDYFGGSQFLAKQQQHDQLKADYAAAHGYLLLAIPYTVDTQDKMNQYLDTHLPCIL